MTYSQVWWPILWICALHINPSKVHTHRPWTHTRSSGQSFMLQHPGSSWGFGALLKGTSVVVLKMEESARHSLPPPTIPAGPRLEQANIRLRVRLSNGYGFPTSHKGSAAGFSSDVRFANELFDWTGRTPSSPNRTESFETVRVSII